MVIELNNENFEKEVIQSDKPVIVDFWASWCGPCKMLAPIFDKVSGDFTDLKFAKLNVDEAKEVSMKYGISSIPCLIGFKEGKEIGRILGAHPEEALKQKIRELF